MGAKIVFLDIDGVLLPGERLWSGKRTICPGRTAMFNNFLDEVDAEVVISSTWRIFTPRSFFVETFPRLYEDYMTIKAYPAKHIPARGWQIKAWLNEHYGEVDKYVIIDDDSHMFPDQPFVKTNFKDGLRLTHIEQMKAHLT